MISRVPQKFFGKTIQGDARTFQSSLKLELFDLLRSTINLPVTQIFYFLPRVLTQMRLKKLHKKCFEIYLLWKTDLEIILLYFYHRSSCVLWSCLQRPINGRQQHNIIKTVGSQSLLTFDTFQHHGIPLKG